MEFKFWGTGYYDYLRYKNHSVVALCDTGATYSSMDLFTLEALTGHKAKEVLRYIENRIKNNTVNVRGTYTASGRLDKVVPIIINNVILAGQKIDKFYAYLNIDSELWNTNGIPNCNEDTEPMTPVVLIGLNMIRFSNFIGDKHIIRLNNFNYNDYLAYNKYQHTSTGVINLYQIINGGLTTQDLVANYVNNLIQDEYKK